MQPVRELSGNAKHFLISPDSELGLIPFEALVDQQQHYLIENYAFTYLTSGRDLLRMKVPRHSRSGPLLVANPAFGVPDDETVKAVAVNTRNVSFDNGEPRGRKSATIHRDISDAYFAPLVGAAAEARLIQSLFPDAKLLIGAEATETALKQAIAPSILHLATHGFFIDSGPALRGRPAADGRSFLAASSAENPLLRSGLALAGANRRSSGRDDGILAALEASGLDLWGTKLVVLSACDTGVGHVKTGEGVYGLRRAFVEAGAESLVMSLWPVSDVVVRDLMMGYYKYLKQGRGRGEALRQVQLDMLKRPERRHPFYWASFIQAGEWANLDGKR